MSRWPWLSAAEPSPVNADGTEVEDAGGAHHDIKGHEDITVDATEPPLTNHLQREGTWSNCSWNQVAFDRSHAEPSRIVH